MKITICGIPELGEHCEAGVTHVLSILDPGWPDPIAFSDFGAHHRVAFRFNDVIGPLPGAILPTREDVALLLEYGREVMKPAAYASADPLPCRRVALDCLGGAAAAQPSRRARRPRSRRDRRLRPRAWPNLLLLEYGEAVLGRRGEIVPAVAAQYRRILAADPNSATS